MSEPAGFCDDFHQRVLFNLFNFSNNDHDLDAPATQSVEEENRGVRQISSILANRRPRKRSSIVWKEFKKVTKPDGEVKAICNHCEKEFVGSSKKGTSHLLHHSRICPKKRKKEGGHENRSFENGDLSTQVIIEADATGDRELNSLDLVRSVLKRGMKSFVDDLRSVFEEEMRKLNELLGKLSCRLSFDMFSRRHYLFESVDFLTFYYIDELWEMRSRIIGLYFYDLEELQDSLPALNFNKCICSVVTSNERIESIESYGKYYRIRSLKNYLESEGSISNIMECILECDVFRKMYECFEYVKELLRDSDKDNIVSNIRVKFTRTNMNLQDLPTSTYGAFTDFERNTLMTYAAEFKEAFLELQHMDPDFKSKNLTKEEWDVVTAGYDCLKVIKDATCHLSGKGIRTTANVCIPLICDIWERLLQLEEQSDYWYFGHIAARLRENFVKDYWKENGLALAIASVLDPRFKMNLLEKWYRMIHGVSVEEHIMGFHEDLRRVYNSYSNGVDNYGSSISTSGDVHSQFPEIDLYLGEDVHIPVSNDFDILAWWRGSVLHFPTLSRMARDFLAIPVWKEASAKLTNMFESLTSDIEFRGVYATAKMVLEGNIEDHLGDIDNSTGLPGQECPTNSSPSPKQIMMQSKVWNGEDKATCNGKESDGSSKTGTSHLNNHLIRCPENGKKREDGDKPFENGSLTNNVDVAKYKSAIDDELNGVEVARRIVNRGWSSFYDDMLFLYKEERQKLVTHLNQLPCLFSLAYNLVWVTTTCLTVHFINEVWEVKRKILCIDPSWDDIRILNINKSMCSLVCSDKFIFKEIKDGFKDEHLCLLQSSCINPFCGKFLGIKSFKASFTGSIYWELRRIVSKAVENIWENNGIFEKITKFFEYGRMTNHNGYVEYDQRVKNLTRGHDIYRWLTITMEFKEAFLHEFESVDSDFRMTKEEWLVTTFGYGCLEILKDAAYRLSRKENRIANECLPFIHDLCNKLFGKHAEDVIRECWNWDYIPYFFCKMQDYLQNCVREYWKDNGLALAMAAVLDPRFKMVLVEDFYTMIYDEYDTNLHICRLVFELRSCYNWYANGYDNPESSTTISDDVRSQISELDCYLREPVYHPVSEDFEIIAWWRDSSSRFPTLARMARDLLAIPVWQDNSDIQGKIYDIEDEIENISDIDDDVEISIIILNAFMCLKSLEDN